MRETSEKPKKILFILLGKDLLTPNCLLSYSFFYFRFLYFGMQLLKRNTIYDFSEGNHLWFELNLHKPQPQVETNSWEMLETLYLPQFSNLMQTFTDSFPNWEDLKKTKNLTVTTGSLKLVLMKTNSK